MIEKKESHFIDIAKGVAIFLMLWGHCIQYSNPGNDFDVFENGVFQAIYAFHMPLFMLISGYLFFFSFQKRQLADLLIHRVQGLLQPIVFCSIFGYFITSGLFAVINGNFGALLNGSALSELNELWFLWAVLAASLAVGVVCKVTNRLALQIPLLVVCFGAIALFPSGMLCMYVYPYFVLGFYYGKYREKLPKQIKLLRYLSVIVFPVMLWFYEKKHFIYTTGLHCPGYPIKDIVLINAFRWGIGLVGSVFVLTVLYFVYDRISVRLQKPILTDLLAKAGKKSLQIYALSVPLLSTYLPILFSRFLIAFFGGNNVFVKNMAFYNLVFTVLVAVVYTFGLYWLTRLLEKIKIGKLLFGK